MIKLRERRQLLQRFLVVLHAHLNLGYTLKEAIGKYELSVIPSSLFDSDETLLLPSDKNELLTEVLSKAREALETSKPEEKEKIVIVDAMVMVNAVCKGKDKVKSCSDIKKHF